MSVIITDGLNGFGGADEDELVNIATFDEDEIVAGLAMKALRERFNETYDWCEDCDGLAVKAPHICWEQK